MTVKTLTLPRIENVIEIIDLKNALKTHTVTGGKEEIFFIECKKIKEEQINSICILAPVKFFSDIKDYSRLKKLTLLIKKSDSHPDFPTTELYKVLRIIDYDLI